MSSTKASETKIDAPELTANVKVEKKGMSFLQWVGVVGVGSALIVYVIPRMMQQDAANQAFIQTKMFDVVTESASAQVQAAKAMEDLADAVETQADAVAELSDSQRAFLGQLKPLTQQLGNVATAVTEQVEQSKVDSTTEQ